MNRSGVAEGPKSKQIKLNEKQMHLYIALKPTELEDDISTKRNEELLRKEFLKGKPKEEVVQSLIKRTLTLRREAVLSGSRPEDLLGKYPHLKKPKYVRSLISWFLVIYWFLFIYLFLLYLGECARACMHLYCAVVYTKYGVGTPL